MPEFVALSKNIKKYRNEKKISQIDFAAYCGISTETLSLIEREKVDSRLSTIQKIAAYIGCDTAELFGQL